MARANAAQRHVIQQGLMDAEQWASSLVTWGRMTTEQLQQMGDIAVAEAYRSIVYGSPLTGSPGQPVRFGDLRDSWEVAKLAPGLTEIATASPYARPIEHNWRRVTRRMVKHFRLANPKIKRVTKRVQKQIRLSLGGLRYRNGGPHSVKLTRANWSKIVRYSAEMVGWSR